jgi:hypothetical protein
LSETVPYVVGQWVRGVNFYGREAALAAVLRSSAGCVWVIGLRRVGKTSLLRQLELLAGEERLALFWDLQGVDDEAELAVAFADALLDGGEALARHGIAVAPAADLAETIARVLRAVALRGRRLLLLCDEADALLRLLAAAPATASALQTLLGSTSVTTVLAGSPRCLEAARALASRSPANLFTGLEAPVFLGALEDGEARSLLLQDRLSPAWRPRLAAAAVEAILGCCGNHPLLLQLAGRRCVETGSAPAALEQLGADRTLDHLFAVDFDLLAERERGLLHAFAKAETAGAAAAAANEDADAARRLLQLGLLSDRGTTGLRVPNRFLAAWLRSRCASCSSRRASLTRT